MDRLALHCRVVEATPANPKADERAERIAMQRCSRTPVKAILQATSIDGVLPLRSGIDGSKKTGARSGGEERGAAGAHGGGDTGTGVGDRRAAPKKSPLHISGPNRKASALRFPETYIDTPG